ncbi:aminoadipic semialdehyde synthase [Cavenderia fasciculata]|uniref:Aminoadipic semialdehyde synthase n=1 Tax=Cavenderia fasciculata TaxID=261658 RepID=F4Q0A9_CACFS|nr:aminoadipic semialdehyde synthase [Cavenderia fasciculata]EGG18260.1 aminoadipic semialdehyde synthase [Cavenderia fasciculata]|eukprot:XP_004357083.1 aminoadipic semialdehyde synthase [Cavenderia fasciculata]
MSETNSPIITTPTTTTTSTTRVYTLGLRREDKNRWERRAPLAPSHIEQLVKRGIRCIVQPSTLRNYSNAAYEKAGAIIQEDLRDCDTICAVKEVPSEYLFEGKTYLFFSHTIKAQPYNMPMLDEINNKKIRLIDYERITDNQNKRLVRFGAFAGYAGMIDMLHALGDRLLAKGFSTPFLHVGYSYVYSKLENAMDAVRAIGEEISQVGLPDDLLPFTFAFTSDGAVAQGALSIFKLLPHKMVTPDEMVDLVKNKKGERGILYGTIIKSEHMVEPIDSSKKFDKDDYYKDPSKYKPIFFEKYAPYISCLINCMYWDAKFPRLITIRQMEQLVETGNSRLIGVADISADINGSLEFLMKTTSIDSPLYIYDPKTQEIHDPTTDQKYMYREGILFLAVDNLPTEFPKEATQWFGDHLLQFMEAIVRSDPLKPYDKMNDIPDEIKRATITAHGSLTPPFEYIKELRKKREAMIKRVLIIGAGLISHPVISYLARNPSHEVVVADIDADQVNKAVKFEPDIQTIVIDVNDQSKLDKLVSKQKVVISLLPDDLTLLVAKSCLRTKKHLITTSYLTNEMKQLHQEAKDANLTFLNEMGLDPGVDHLEASRVINSVKKQGGKIRSFVSWCGGLPAPESSDNPMGYKFSWSPRGMLEAVKMPAAYKQDGRDIVVSGQEVYKRVQKVDIFPALSIEGVPNRNCLSLGQYYGIQDSKTIFRGTIRYKGFCQVIEAAVEIGLLDETEVGLLKVGQEKISWNKALRAILPDPLSSTSANDKFSTQEMFRRKLRTRRGYPSKGYDDEKITYILSVFEWLGVFSETIEIAQKGSYFNAFSQLLKGKLEFSPSERDLIILHHIFGIEWPEGRHETKTSTLVYYGTKDLSAMAYTIGLPAAIAAELLLEGNIKETGVVIPITEEFYKPILKALRNEGMTFIHRQEFDKEKDY